MTGFFPTRAAGLDRLAAFVPLAGRAYAEGRNTDSGPGVASAVSRLSPWLRRRLLTETEVVAAVLAEHRLADAEKFVAEVLWRTYWKGWLELRPGVWRQFLAERDAARRLPIARALAAAEAGTTGIEGFDDWARELVETGYLHNHARMWFASIWIFTLRLPWALGADFFLRHLIDADPASNTLSWRWVAGLQTAGKTYLATADNIARYTNGRFAPQGLARSAVPIAGPPVPAARPLPLLPAPDPAAPTVLLVTPEDCHPESVFPRSPQLRSAVVLAADTGGPLAQAFTAGAAADTATRIAAHFDCPVEIVTSLDAAALTAGGIGQIVTACAPTGPIADALAASGLPIIQVRRRWDSQFWPHAQKGFFPFKEKIPAILAVEGIA
jgi:deoxyribodipyrimidine photo-lyase